MLAKGKSCQKRCGQAHVADAVQWLAAFKQFSADHGTEVGEATTETRSRPLNHCSRLAPHSARFGCRCIALSKVTALEREASQAAFADRHGLHRSYVSMVLSAGPA